MISNVNEVGGRDPHDVLEVPRGADRRQVIQAFRRKVRRGGHPDTGGDARAFEEIVHARDALLGQAQPTARTTVRPAPRATPRPTPRPTPRTRAEPRADRGSEPEQSPPRQTSKLAILTVVLAALGPLFWPFAIAVGHLALWRIKRTGQGGGTVVPIVLLFLYVITLPILARILSVVLIP